jgi:histidyl-tRNA synthetase
MKNQMKRADGSGAMWCVIAGESELAAGQVAVKHLRNAAGDQLFEDQKLVAVDSVREMLLAS